MLAPAKPICLTWISSPFAGADVNIKSWLLSEYALALLASLGCWTTPFIVTTILLLLGGVLDKLNSVVLPSPVRLSTLLSDISKVSIVFAITVPQKTSFDVGAFLNCIFSLSTTLKPTVYDEILFGFWITLLIAICNWV